MSMNKAIAAVVILLLFVAGVYFFTYNGLVSAQEGVDAQWHQVENQYQRRADLIPNLIETVKASAAHEEKIFTEVTKYRDQWIAAATPQEKIEAAKDWDPAVNKLRAELNVSIIIDPKARENFLALQAQLEGTENRIAVERMRYNE